MRRRDIEMLQRVAGQALDRARQAAQEQAQAVSALEAAVARVDAACAEERGRAEQDAAGFLMLAAYLDEQRSRRDRLASDLAAAQAELDRRLRATHEAWLEARRYEEMLARIDAAERIAQARREAAFLDWVAERQHARAERG